LNLSTAWLSIINGQEVIKVLKIFQGQGNQLKASGSRKQTKLEDLAMQKTSKATI